MKVCRVPLRLQVFVIVFSIFLALSLLLGRAHCGLPLSANTPESGYPSSCYSWALFKAAAQFFSSLEHCTTHVSVALIQPHLVFPLAFPCLLLTVTSSIPSLRFPECEWVCRVDWSEEECSAWPKRSEESGPKFLPSHVTDGWSHRENNSFKLLLLKSGTMLLNHGEYLVFHTLCL